MFHTLHGERDRVITSLLLLLNTSSTLVTTERTSTREAPTPSPWGRARLCPPGENRLAGGRGLSLGAAGKAQGRRGVHLAALTV